MELAEGEFTSQRGKVVRVGRMRPTAENAQYCWELRYGTGFPVGRTVWYPDSLIGREGARRVLGFYLEDRDNTGAAIPIGPPSHLTPFTKQAKEQ